MARRIDDDTLALLVEEIRRADEWTGTGTTWEGEYELVTIRLRRCVGPVRTGREAS